MVFEIFFDFILQISSLILTDYAFLERVLCVSSLQISQKDKIKICA